MIRTHMRRLAVLVATAASVLILGIQPAMAVPPVEVVHAEKVQAGPYAVTVSFSEWPLRAERSLDILFEPAGGVAGRKGYLRPVSPTGEVSALGLSNTLSADKPLARHPRARQAWGLDIVALPEEGAWKFEITVTGREGTGKGTLALTVGERPGPPALPAWIVGLLPLIALPPLVILAWVRTRPYRLAAASRWRLTG